MTYDKELLEKITAMMEKNEEFFDAVADKFEEELEKIENDEITAEEIVEEEAPVETVEVLEEETPIETEEVIEEEAPVATEEVVEKETPVETVEVVEEKPLPVPPTGDHKPSLATRIEKKFNAWNPKTRVGKFFAKDRHNAMVGAMILLCLATGGWQLTEYLIPQDVTVEYYAFGEEDQKIKVSSRATCAEDVLADADIDVTEHDYIYPSEDIKLKSGDTIVVKKSVETKAEIIGEEQTFYLIPGTAEDNLKFNNVPYDTDDMVFPHREMAVAADTHLVFKEVHFTTEEKQEKVAAQSVVVLDPSLYSGKVATTAGHDGEGIFEYKTTYVNGVATGTSKEVKKWIDEPVDNALRLGTSLTGHTGTYKVSRTFIANTTAYYMGENARGAAGGRCVYGTCAVDPKVIPYGTLLFVEGYGVAVANDCGGAVKGNILDLWMHSYNESCQWGRRYVKAYVLTK